MYGQVILHRRPDPVSKAAEVSFRLGRKWQLAERRVAIIRLLEKARHVSSADRPAGRQATSIAPAPAGYLQACFIPPALRPCACLRTVARGSRDRRDGRWASRRDPTRW
jgi:hypothetical protein